MFAETLIFDECLIQGEMKPQESVIPQFSCVQPGAKKELGDNVYMLFLWERRFIIKDIDL